VPETAGDHSGQRLAQALAELAEVQYELEQERYRRAETQSLFDLVLGAMSDAIVLVDAPGRIARVNDAAVRLTGRPADALVGSLAAELFEAGYPGTPWDILAHSPEGRLPAAEATVRSVDRGPVPVSVSCSLLRTPNGRVVGEVYAMRDLSETERLLHELEEAESRWRLQAELGDLLGREVDPRESLGEVCRWLGRSVRVAAAVVLVDGPVVNRVVAWPPEGAVFEQLGRLAGRPPDRSSALDTSLRELRVIHADGVRPDFPLLSAAGAPEGVASAAVVPLVARDAVLGALVVHGPRAGDVSNRTVAVVEALAGRIAYAVANSQLGEAVGQLEGIREAARFREELLSGVSHDMQTPLAVLLGSLAALQREDRVTPERRRRLHEGMARQGARLRRLVQQFLDYSRVEAGRPVALRLRSTDVRVVVRRVRDTFGAGRELILDVPDDLPPAFADPDRLDQVLANLVSNAVKFSPADTPVDVTARATARSIEISVTDRGVGMTPGELARAFEKFYRSGRAENIPGTGLGLYISRVLVEAQGGTVSVTSRPGEGSRFTVTLPRYEGQDPA